MADLGDLLGLVGGDAVKLALKIVDVLDDFDDAEVGDEITIPEIKTKVGGQRWRIPAHKAVRER